MNQLDIVRIIPFRFDLLAKIIYCKFRKLGIKTEWHVDLYKQHIIVFNGGWEHPGTKIHVDHFLLEFNRLIDSINTNGFSDKISTVPVAKNNMVINGSHRLAICYVYNKLCHFKIDDTRSTGTLYDFNFFRNYTKNIPTGLTNIWTDPMALEYCKLNNESQIMIFFPRINQHNLTQNYNIIRKYGNIVYFKLLKLCKNGLTNLICELYYGENWDKSAKVDLCYGENTCCVYVFNPHQTKTPNDIISMKTELRQFYGINKHSVHINDTHEETIRVAKMVLNQNSNHFINNAIKMLTPHNSNLFNKFIQIYNNLSSTQKESILIDSSFVLAIFGIREANDIDFISSSISTPETISQFTNIEGIDLHNNEVTKYLKLSHDDLIYNPNNHFYHHGIKFMSLHCLKLFKKNRNEPKDTIDVKLIDKLIG